MPTFENPEAPKIADSGSFSMQNFFDDISNKGIVSAAWEHPLEAGTTVVAGVAAAAVAGLAGRALAGAMERGLAADTLAAGDSLAAGEGLLAKDGPTWLDITPNASQKWIPSIPARAGGEGLAEVQSPFKINDFDETGRGRSFSDLISGLTAQERAQPITIRGSYRDLKSLLDGMDIETDSVGPRYGRLELPESFQFLRPKFAPTGARAVADTSNFQLKPIEDLTDAPGPHIISRDELKNRF